MKTFKFLSCIFLIFCCVAGTSVAQQRKAGLTGAAFLKVGVGARAAAMGSAVTAISGDINQIFWNPAGITRGDALVQASFSYNRWIADIAHNSAAIAYRVEDIGTIGVGFISFGLSGIAADRDVFTNPVLQVYQIDQQTSATYDYSDVAVLLSFARDITSELSLGITLKYISQSIDDQNANAVAIDVGSVYRIGLLDWKIAARMNNLGSDMKYYDIAFGLPLQFTIGTAITPFVFGDSKVTAALDAVKPQDGPQYFFSGIEYSFMDMVYVRGGYKLNYSGTDDGGTSTRSPIKSTIEGFSAGAGLMTELAGYGVHVDYAFTQMEILDAAHRVTLSLSMK